MNLNTALKEIAAAVRKEERSHLFCALTPTELAEATDAYFARGGKLMRPALCLLFAHALGGVEGARRALAPALATELFHLFTLVHDDVIDHDTLRRGEDTAHILAAKRSGIQDEAAAHEYGVSAAILAGDVLFSRAVELLCTAPHLSDASRLCLTKKLSSDTLPRLICGEAVDTKFAYVKDTPTQEELVTVYRNKTGILFEFALFAGAVCAKDAEPDAATKEAVAAAAAHIGEAFQLTDDYLGLIASEAEMGKSALSDIREGKQTFFVRFAEEAAPKEELDYLKQILRAQNASEEEICAARNILLRLGTKPYRERILCAKEKADALLLSLPPSTSRDLLSELFEKMIHRQN